MEGGEETPLSPGSIARLLSLSVTDPAKRFRRLPPGACADLLRVLTSPSNVRADVIRQFHERGYEGMVEALTDLEADDLLREQLILVLRTIRKRRRKG
jgi:hypothetical protein